MISALLAAWIEAQAIGVPTDTERSLLFANTYTGVNIPEHLTPWEWRAVDLTQHGVPKDAKAVFLQGILRVTHGTHPNHWCQVTLHFRQPGDVKDRTYIMQTGEQNAQNGVRTNAAAWVPVKDGKIEVKWENKGAWGGAWKYPIGCSLGFNLTIGAYAR